MCVTAIVYGIEQLKNLAERNFRKAVRKTWDSASFIRLTKYTCSLPESTESNLRSVILKWAVDERSNLRKCKQFTAFLQKSGQFHLDFTMALMERLEVDRWLYSSLKEDEYDKSAMITQTVAE